MLDRLPAEIVDHILLDLVALFPPYDRWSDPPRRALSACRQLCRAVRARTLPIIWHDLVLDDSWRTKQLNKAGLVGQAGEEFRACVRSVRIKDLSDMPELMDMQEYMALPLVKQIPLLEELEIVGSCRPVEMDDVISLSSNLRSLTLQALTLNPPSALPIPPFNHLRSLSIALVTGDESVSSLLRPSILPSLKALQIHFGPKYGGGGAYLWVVPGKSAPSSDELLALLDHQLETLQVSGFALADMPPTVWQHKTPVLATVTPADVAEGFLEEVLAGNVPIRHIRVLLNPPPPPAWALPPDVDPVAAKTEWYTQMISAFEKLDQVARLPNPPHSYHLPWRIDPSTPCLAALLVTCQDQGIDVRLHEEEALDLYRVSESFWRYSGEYKEGERAKGQARGTS